MEVRRTKVRRLSVVVDLQDFLSPPLTIEDHGKLRGEDLDPERFRVVEIEVLACPEDGGVVLTSECGKCPRFIRRYRDEVHCVEAKP